MGGQNLLSCRCVCPWCNGLTGSDLNFDAVSYRYLNDIDCMAEGQLEVGDPRDSESSVRANPFEASVENENERTPSTRYYGIGIRANRVHVLRQASRNMSCLVS